MRIIVFAAMLVMLFACSHPVAPVAHVRTIYLAELDSLEQNVLSMQHQVMNANYHSARHFFDRARIHYKRMEALTEFYFPGVSKAINGPALDKIEEDDEKLIEATGFQVIEELLFASRDETPQRDEVLTEARILRSSITRLKELMKETTFSDENIFESQRLQLLRIMSLGISGFDSPVRQNSIPEARASLEGIELVLSCYRNTLPETGAAIYDSVRLHFSLAKQLLSEQDFDHFDRASFITKAMNPISRILLRYQRYANIPLQRWPGAVNLERPTFFEQDVYNENFFAPSYNQRPGREVRALGELLFFDPILSGNNSRSCASCHKPAYAFADNKDKSITFTQNGKVRRNAPTLVNSAFQQSQFWDGRVAYIEDQVNDVVANADEMHGDFDHAIAILRRSAEYSVLFREAFPDAGESVTARNMQKAIAAYIRSLTGMNSRFDRYLRGDHTAIDAREVHGFNLFMGKAKCGTCHFIPLFNGTIPPVYRESESEVLAVPATPVIVKASMDADRGRYDLFPHALFDRMFKTPTIRNAVLTAPYMHNGVYTTLEEVLDFYNRGGGSGIGIAVENQTLPPDKLNLSDEEQGAIIAFIHTLTDTTGLTRIPKRLPDLADAELNRRTPGGRY